MDKHETLNTDKRREMANAWQKFLEMETDDETIRQIQESILDLTGKNTGKEKVDTEPAVSSLASRENATDNIKTNPETMMEATKKVGRPRKSDQSDTEKIKRPRGRPRRSPITGETIPAAELRAGKMGRPEIYGEGPRKEKAERGAEAGRLRHFYRIADIRDEQRTELLKEYPSLGELEKLTPEQRNALVDELLADMESAILANKDMDNMEELKLYFVSTTDFETWNKLSNLAWKYNLQNREEEPMTATQPAIPRQARGINKRRQMEFEESNRQRREAREKLVQEDPTLELMQDVPAENRILIGKKLIKEFRKAMKLGAEMDPARERALFYLSTLDFAVWNTLGNIIAKYQKAGLIPASQTLYAF